MTDHSNRRDFFSKIVNSLHGAALMSLLGSDLYAAPVYDLKAKAPPRTTFR